MKYPNTTLNLLTVPEGYILVEFFGSHDFGWLKEGTVHPMTYDGKLPFEDGKIGEIMCCQNTMKYLFHCRGIRNEQIGDVLKF